jgi:hypothetical protein
MSINRYKAGFTLVPPDNAVQTEVPPTAGPFPGTLGIHTILVCDLLNAVMTREILPYPRNRAAKHELTDSGAIRTTAGLALKVVKHVIDKFNPHALNTIICWRRNSDKRLVMSGGHNRIQAMLHRYWMGTMTQDELMEEVSFKIITEEEFLKTYHDHNMQAGHRAKESVVNKDFCYGHILHEQVYPHLSERALRFFLSLPTIHHACGNVLYALSQGYRGTDLWIPPYILCQCVNEAKNHWYDPAGTLTLSDSDAKELARAINKYVVVYINCLKSDEDQASQLSDMLRTSAWIWLYVINRMSDDDRLPADDRLVRGIIRNSNDLSKNIASHGGWRAKNVEKHCERIYKIVRRNGRRVRKELEELGA